MRPPLPDMDDLPTVMLFVDLCRQRIFSSAEGTDTSPSRATIAFGSLKDALRSWVTTGRVCDLAESVVTILEDLP